MKRSPLPLVPIVLMSIMLFAPTSVEAQGASRPDMPGAVLQREHPDLHGVLEAFELNHAGLFERLAEAGGSAGGLVVGGAESLEMGLYGELAQRLRSHRAGESMPATSGLGARADAVIRRANALRREIFDIYADPGVADRAAAVDAAVDSYLSEPGLSLPDVPKSMDIMHMHASTMLFDMAYPELNALIRASQWLQFTSLEPMILFPAGDERRAGIAMTVERFWQKLDAPPTEMPMAPTIAPELRLRHVRAAAIFDNLNMMYEVLADVLTDQRIGDKNASIARTVDVFTDRDFEVVTELEWTLMALRHGIYNQGGPALGTLDRPERGAGGGHHGGGAGGRTNMSPGM